MVEIKRFSTPDPNVGTPKLFEVEVVRVRTETRTPDDGGDPYEEEVRERETLTFGARPDVSGGVLLQVEMIGGVGKGKNRPNARGADALMDFYDAALMPENGVAEVDGESVPYLGISEYRKIVEDEHTYVHVDTLLDMAQWLYGEYADRPTKQRRR